MALPCTMSVSLQCERSRTCIWNSTSEMLMMEKRTKLNARTSVGDRGVLKQHVREVRRPRVSAPVAEEGAGTPHLNVVGRCLLAVFVERTCIGSSASAEKNNYICTHPCSQSLSNKQLRHGRGQQPHEGDQHAESVTRVERESSGIIFPSTSFSTLLNSSAASDRRSFAQVLQTTLHW